MKIMVPYIIVFALSLGLCVYNISSPITVTLFVGIILIACIWSLIGGTLALIAVRLAKGL